MPNTPDDTLPVSRLLNMDKLCDEFEAVLKLGEDPSIEEFLTRVRESERSSFRQELTVLRDQYRAKAQKKEGAPPLGKDPSLQTFIDTLLETGLMTRAEVDEFRATLPEDEQPETAEDLAKVLYRHQKLTRFQTQAVFQGRTKGLVVGNYVVLDKIGKGGMGHVYKAQHRRMKREVALKVLPSHIARQKTAVERFHREVIAAARLSHPNIVTAYDADEADGVHFLVMELVEGVDLNKLVRSRGTLSVTKAIDYVIQTAAGLQYAHEQGIIHRDIKPANLLLDKSGTVKILDMGLARFEREMHESTAAESLTQSGQVMGTLDYMAPEQAMDTRHASAKADIYSLGCTLCFLLTGQAVFEGQTMATKIIAHREQPVPSLRDHREDVSVQLDQVFQRMLAKAPEERPESMEQVIRDLEACRDVDSGSENPSSISLESTDGGATLPYIPISGEMPVGPAPPVPSDSDSTKDGHWLQEELPESPTLFQPLKPAPKQLRKSPIQPILIGSIAAAVLVLIGVVTLFLSSRAPRELAVETEKSPAAEEVGAIPVADVADQVDSRVPATFVALDDPEWTWSEPENLGPSVNSENFEDFPSVTADGLTLVFQSTRTSVNPESNERDFWISVRKSVNEPFGAPTTLAAFAGIGVDCEDPSISSDGLTLLFSAPASGHGRSIWQASRMSTTSPFVNLVELEGLNDRGRNYRPRLSPDGRILTFGTSGPETGPELRRRDLWMATRRHADGPFGPAKSIGALCNSPENEWSGTLSADNLTLIFASCRRTGGSGELWVSRRDQESDSFGNPVPLDGPFLDEIRIFSPFLTADGMTLYFASHRSGGLGDRDLWCSRRVRKTSDDGSTSDVADSRLPQDVPAHADGKIRLTSAAIPNSAELVHLNEISHERAGDEEPWIAHDGRTLYWVRYAYGLRQQEEVIDGLLCADRPNGESDFSLPRQLNASGRRHPTVSMDGLTLVCIARPEQEDAPRLERLHMATRSSQGEPFGALRQLEEIDGQWPTSRIKFPAFVGTKNKLLFTAMTDELTCSVVWPDRIRPLADATVSTFDDLAFRPQGIRMYGWPFLTDDELYLLCTDESGLNDGTYDGGIMLWRRDSIDVPFERGVYLTLPNGERLQGKAPRYCAATKELFFSSNNPHGTRDLVDAVWDLWVIKGFDPDLVEFPQ